jgi:hypothetical protein
VLGGAAGPRSPPGRRATQGKGSSGAECVFVIVYVSVYFDNGKKWSVTCTLYVGFYTETTTQRLFVSKFCSEIFLNTQTMSFNSCGHAAITIQINQDALGYPHRGTVPVRYTPCSAPLASRKPAPAYWEGNATVPFPPTQPIPSALRVWTLHLCAQPPRTSRLCSELAAERRTSRRRTGRRVWRSVCRICP